MRRKCVSRVQNKYANNHAIVSGFLFHALLFTGNRRADQTNGISGEARGEVQEIIYGSVFKRHYLSGMKSMYSVLVMVIGQSGVQFGL